MSAEEHQHDHAQPAEPSIPGESAAPAESAVPAPSGNSGLRSAWPGSRRVAVLVGVVAFGLLAGAGVAFATTGSPAHPAAGGAATAAKPSPSASPPLPWSHRLPSRLGLPRNLPFHIGSLPGGLPFGGVLGPVGGMFGAIHGQYVAPKSGGGYQTIDFQNGKVTAVSSTSITLRSADGYTHTYAVNSSTTVNAQRNGIGSIKTGNQVAVQATVSGGTATAAQITDISLLQQGFHHFFGSLPGKNVKTGKA
jgi:hypothetical protein